MLSFALAGCSDDPSIDSDPREQVTKTSENATTPNTISTGDSGNKSQGNVDDPSAVDQMAELQFTKFELEVDYGPNKEFHFDYEQLSENGDYKAELHDEVNDKNLKGMEAFKTLHNLTKNIDLSGGKPKEEVINIILNLFQLGENYTKFSLEYTLRDGTEIDIEDKNNSQNAGH